MSTHVSAQIATDGADKTGQDGAAITMADQAPAGTARLCAAERVTRARSELAKVRESLAQVEQQHATAQAVLDRLAQAERTTQAAVETAAVEAQRCQGIVVAAQADLLIVSGTDGEAAAKEALASAERALVTAEASLVDAHGAQATAARDLEAQRATLTRQIGEAAGKIATRKALVEAFEQHLARDHEAAGRDRLAALRRAYAALVEQRRAGYAAVDAIEQEVRTFVATLPQELAAWPDLAKLPVAEQVEQPLTSERQVLEAFGRYLDTFERNRGGHLHQTIGGVNVAAVLQQLDERVIQWLSQTNSERAPTTMLVAHIRNEIARALALFG